MAESMAGRDNPKIGPKDVFDRSNMPSRWERLTGVAPKIPEDRVFLSFVAARYLGEKRLPHPDSLAMPQELLSRERTGFLCGWTGVSAVLLGIVGMVTGVPVLAGLAAIALIVAVAVVVVVSPRRSRRSGSSTSYGTHWPTIATGCTGAARSRCGTAG